MITRAHKMDDEDRDISERRAAKILGATDDPYWEKYCPSCCARLKDGKCAHEKCPRFGKTYEEK